MTEPRRVIAGRRTADEWENSVGFFGIGKKKWEEQAKAAQAEAEAQADDVKSALPNSDAEASDRTLAERVNEQQRWENSLRRFVQAESTRMQQEEQKSKDTSDLNVDALKQSAQHSGSSAEPSASTADEAKTSGSAEGKKTVGASSQAANADAAQKGSFTQEAAQTPDTSAPKRAPQISEYRATSIPADAFETNSSATAVPSSNAASVSGTASAQTEAGSQKQNVQDALKEFNETKYGTEHEGNTSSVSSHADAAASPSSSAEKDSVDVKTPNVEDREREKLAAGVVPTDAEEKPAFVPAPGVESKNSNDKKTANADSKSTLESTPQESESASDVKVSAYEKKSPSPEAQATSGLESTPSASKKSDKIEFVGSGATGSAKHLDDRNDPETLAPEKNRSVETSAEKTSAEKMAVQHEKTVADEVPAHSSTDKDSKKQDVEKIARDEKASQSGAAAASSVEGNEKAEVLTPENPLHDLVTAMRGYGSGKVSYELRQLGDDMHYRIFHRGSEVEQGVVVPTDAWFSSIASLYVRAQDAGRVWNRALVVANPSENGLVAVQASYTNTADASSYTTDYVLETSEKDSASQKDSSAKSAESAKSSADQSTTSTDAADQKTSTAKTSALAGSADDTSSQKESEAKLAQDKSDEQAKAAETQKADAGQKVKGLNDHTQDVKSADVDKANTQNSQKSEKSEHTVDSEKKFSEAQDKAQEVSAKAQADTAKSDSATAESTRSGSSTLAAGTLGAAGVTAAGIASSSKSDREDSRYEYDYDADPQNVTGRHDAQAAEQSKTEADSAKAGAVSDKSEKSSVSGVSVAKDSSDLSAPEAEVEKTKVEKSSEDEEELNSMQAALATIVASSEAKKTASNAKEDAADTSAAVKTSGTDSKSAADKTSEDSQKAADSESTVKAESDAKTTAGYTSEKNQSANVTQAVVEESQADTTSTHSSSALPKHVDDLALVPEVEKDSLTGSTATKHQESASNKRDALAGQSATAVAAQSETSNVDGKTAQHESADLPPAEAEPDTPAHQAHSSVLAGDALAEGNLVLTDAKVIEHLAPVTEALFGENGSAKDATTVLIRVRSVGSYYDVLTHVRRNGFWEQVRTFELVSEEDLGIPTLKADSYSEGEGSPLAMSLTFTPGVPVQSAFDYSNEQAFVRYPRQLEADRYVEELRMFPRLGAKIPAHMANALSHWSM